MLAMSRMFARRPVVLQQSQEVLCSYGFWGIIRLLNYEHSMTVTRRHDYAFTPHSRNILTCRLPVKRATRPLRIVLSMTLRRMLHPRFSRPFFSFLSLFFSLWGPTPWSFLMPSPRYPKNLSINSLLGVSPRPFGARCISSFPEKQRRAFTVAMKNLTNSFNHYCILFSSVD